MSVFANNIIVTVSNITEILGIGYTLWVYEVVSGATINQDNSVGLHFDTWRGRSMTSDNVVGC